MMCRADDVPFTLSYRHDLPLARVQLRGGGQTNGGQELGEEVVFVVLGAVLLHDVAVIQEREHRLPALGPDA